MLELSQYSGTVWIVLFVLGILGFGAIHYFDVFNSDGEITPMYHVAAMITTTLVLTLGYLYITL